jgi:hypothetical protein
MAVLKTGTTNLVADNATTKDGKKRVEPTVVDITSNTLKAGKKSKLDPTEDAWSYSAPPAKGAYSLKVFLAKDAFKQGFFDPQDEDSVFYEGELECKIVSDKPDEDGFTVFGRVSTKIGRGKNISTMAGLLVRMGFKIPDEATPLQLARMLKAAIAKEPVLHNCLCDWSGWSKNDEKVIYTSMDDFPEDEEGNPMHEVTITNKDGGREKIKATLKIREWGTKAKSTIAEAPKAVKASQAATPAPAIRKTKPAPPAPVVVEEEEETVEVAASGDGEEEEITLEEDE